ncbi:FtsX-like permease family protein [Geminicoccaceae bacterium 1502E]|nr:FtsX-like permease family protein [Geminicoccaceae bacterium 1502E]
MRNLKIAWIVARREMRGGMRGLAVFLACLAIGVAAIAAVGSVQGAIDAALRRDAAVLLGGDAAIENANRPLPAAELAGLLPQGARLSEAVRTNVMVASAAAEPDGGRHVVAALKAVDGAYPLFGAVELAPAMRLQDALENGGAVAEQALLTRLGVAVGDRLQLGEREIELRAVLVREPDVMAGRLEIAPRLIVAQDALAASAVLQPGALAHHLYRIALPDGTDPAAWVEALHEGNPESSWRARSRAEVQPRIARLTDRLATFLSLAGLTSLLVGGLGVGLAVRGYVESRIATIATLKSLGAGSRQVLAIYLVQILLLAAVGIAAGLVAGALLPFAIDGLLAGLLPIRLDHALYPGPLLLAAGAGFLTAFVFALWPLSIAREISPAALFRDEVAPERRLPRPSALAAIGGGLALLALLAVLGVPQKVIGMWFVGAAVAASLLLALLARLVIGLLHRLGRHGPLPIRLAAGNLRRPGSSAASVLVALGAGLAVLTMVGLLQGVLERELEQGLPDRAPSVVFIDIQPDQWQRFGALVEETEGAQIAQSAPLLRARVVRIAGVPVDEAAVAEHVRWTVRRDRGLTYAAATPPDTELVAGRWWPEDYAGEPLVSVEEEVARGYGVGVGDTLAFNLLGRVIEARIASIRREIDWSRGRLGFVFILSPGVIDKAPHTMIAAVEAAPGVELPLTEAVARALPNVTPISIGEVVARLGEAIGTIGLAVRIVAAVTLATGALVLAGAVNVSRQRQLYQTVLLKVLGARRADLLRLFLAEYASLGAGAALLGLVIGGIGAWLVVWLVLDLDWHLAPLPAIAVAAGALLVTLASGALATWRLLRAPAGLLLRRP